MAIAAAAALGYDGKWVLHPGQVDIVNAEFSPSQEDYDRAELIIEAYEYYVTVQGRGAARLDGEMIEEASRKRARVAAARGRAAGTMNPPVWRRHCSSRAGRDSSRRSSRW